MAAAGGCDAGMTAVYVDPASVVGRLERAHDLLALSLGECALRCPVGEPRKCGHKTALAARVRCAVCWSEWSLAPDRLR